MIMCGGLLMMPGRKEGREKDANLEKKQKKEPEIRLEEWKGELGGP